MEAFRSNTVQHILFLFTQAIDRDCDGTLTEEEFVEAYNKR
jgi:hypothetical protein